MISDELTATDVQTVLHQLGIEPGRTDSEGWTTIKSPLREEKNASFGLNIETGAWKDFSTDDSGDVVTLIERIQGMDNKEAVKWIAEQTSIAGRLYSTPTNGHKKKKFWTDENIQLIKSAIQKLKDNPEHPLVKVASEYDQLGRETLLKYGCGIIEQWGKEWLALPYPTGCQLYRREKEKEIRTLKGSSPGSSFFGMKQTEGRDNLFIAKSPRECMLLSQKYGNMADVIGLATGEQGNVSKRQSEALRSQNSDSNYSDIFVFLDCDTQQAKKTTQEFAASIASGAAQVKFGGKVKIVNIHKETTGVYKDVTDCIRDNMDEGTFHVLLDAADCSSFISPTLSEREQWFKPSDPYKESVPELEFVVDGYAAKGLITVIGGAAGSGKSLFNQILFQKRNNELLPTSKGEAIYLTGADSSVYEIRRRAKAIKENNGLKTVCIPEDIYCTATNDVFMNELIDNVIKYGADAVIFDTLADFHDGNLYEAELANKTMKGFTRLARTANVAVILITHTRKGSKVKTEYNVEDISDSRVFGTKADFVFGLRSEYQKDGSNLIELQNVKSRSAQHMQPLRAEIYLNSITNELKISTCEKLFSNELEIQSKQEDRHHKIKEVHRMRADGKSVREIADELSIATGTVSKYAKEQIHDSAPF